MSESSVWKPGASLDTLRLRARLLSTVRRFFDDRGYFEVDTPLVSHERVVDAHLEPFVVSSERGACGVGPAARRDAALTLYLQTSPEFAMKRLLAAGAEAIYQIAHVFRYGEIGRLHNPEFAMVEWYRAGDTHHEQMQVVEELVAFVCDAALTWKKPSAGPAPQPLPERPLTPFARTTYRDAFVRHAGADVLPMETGAMHKLACDRGLHPPPGLSCDDRDGWLNWLLAEVVEPKLGCERPEFLYDYPASQAALARVRRDDPPVAERFELYWRGIELCNGYHELANADELRQRVAAESSRRERNGLAPLAAPARLMAAIEAGLPDCSGVALGFDRLMLLATRAEAVGEVMPFTFEHA